MICSISKVCLYLENEDCVYRFESQLNYFYEQNEDKGMMMLTYFQLSWKTNKNKYCPKLNLEYIPIDISGHYDIVHGIEGFSITYILRYNYIKIYITGL